ncbi:MAG: NADH-quinone oxidoreductase subunit N [Isosphaeraceae bacterium]
MNPQSAIDVVRGSTLILLPEMLLLFAAMAIMTASAFIKRPRRFWCAWSAGALVLALLVLWTLKDSHTDPHSAVALNDALSYNSRIVLILMGLVLVSLAHAEPGDDRAGEFFGSLLIVNAGAMLVAAANELVFLFVGLELVSIPTYLLLYLSRRTRTTQEAVTKYFLLSIFASSLLLYGLAFLYGTTGISNLKALTFLVARLPTGAPHSALALVAIVFIISGLCFRVAAVPLQFYAPDVYQGSPTVIAALLAWVPKAVGFLAMIKTLTAVFSAREVTNPLVQKAIIITWIIAAATMIWGNVLALLQNNLKRLMAYSSIAHAGYLMVGITASFANDGGTGGIYYGSESVLFYLVVYALMTVGTFGGFMLLRLGGRELETVEELDGLGWVHPWPALGLSICLLSLSGIPPLAGFMGKLEIFAAAIAARERVETSGFLLLAVIGMLTSAIGAYYYLRIVVVMYLRPSRQPVELSGGWPVALPVAACAGLSLLLGVFSGPLVHGARSAAESALARPDPGVIRTADSIQFPPTAALAREPLASSF